MTPCPLTDLLGIRRGQTVAIVGCGGKSSLLQALAEEWRGRGRVLLSTTTKIHRQEAALCDALWTTPEQWRNPPTSPGLFAAGIPAGPKLAALPMQELQAIRAHYDLVLLECDGSRHLPLKGWREDEPVIPPYTDITVGVAVVWPVGKPMEEDLAFQPDLFRTIAGAEPGQILEPTHLARAIAHPRGLFHNARGRCVLFFNQIENPVAAKQVDEILALLAGQGANLPDYIVASSLKSHTFTPILLPKENRHD